MVVITKVVQQLQQILQRQVVMYLISLVEETKQNLLLQMLRFMDYLVHVKMFMVEEIKPQ